MEEINKEKIEVSDDKNYVSYTLSNGDVIEADIIWGITNHLGENIETLDYLEKVDNAYQVKNADAYIEKIYDAMEEILPFK